MYGTLPELCTQLHKEWLDIHRFALIGSWWETLVEHEVDGINEREKLTWCQSVRWFASSGLTADPHAHRICTASCHIYGRARPPGCSSGSPCPTLPPWRPEHPSSDPVLLLCSTHRQHTGNAGQMWPVVSMFLKQGESWHTPKVAQKDSLDFSSQFFSFKLKADHWAVH